MITVLMKKDAQYSLDGVTPTTLLAGKVYEVSQEAWDCFYVDSSAEKINQTSDVPVDFAPIPKPTIEAVADVVADVVEVAQDKCKRQTKDVK